MFATNGRFYFHGFGQTTETPKSLGYVWGAGRKGWYKLKDPAKSIIPFRSKPEWIQYIPKKLYVYNFVQKGWLIPGNIKTLILKTAIPEWDAFVPATPVWLAPDLTKNPFQQGFTYDKAKSGWYNVKHPKNSFISSENAPGWYFYIPGVRKALQAEYLKLWTSGSIPKEMTFEQWLAQRPPVPVTPTTPVVEPEVPVVPPEPTPTDGGGGGTPPSPEPTPTDGEWVLDPLTGQYIWQPAPTTPTTPTTPEVPSVTPSIAGFQLPENWPIYGVIAIGAFLVMRGGKKKRTGRKRRRYT